MLNSFSKFALFALILCLTPKCYQVESLCRWGEQAFLNENKKVLGFVENTTPLKEKLVGIDQPSRYVLETNSGWVKDNEIKVGDPIQIKKVRSLKIS